MYLARERRDGTWGAMGATSPPFWKWFFFFFFCLRACCRGRWCIPYIPRVSGKLTQFFWEGKQVSESPPPPPSPLITFSGLARFSRLAARRTDPGGGGEGGYSDLVPTGVCRWSRQTRTHLFKGSFWRKRVPIIRGFYSRKWRSCVL